MVKKFIGTGITKLLFGLKGKDLKVIPYNEMSPQQFEQLDSFLGKLGFILSSNEYTLTKQQSDYVINQIKQLDLYREKIMPGKNPDFTEFIPRDKLGVPERNPDIDKFNKMTKVEPEFKGFKPKVIEGSKGKTKPGSKIDYGKMEEFLGVKLRGDETFDELLEIEKRMKNKDPEDFAGGGLATAIAKIKGKYGKKAIMKGKTKKKSDKQKRREMFEEFNKRNKEREEFIFGGGVGLKNLIKSLAKKQGLDKPSDVLKKGNPKSQVPKRAKPFVSDRDMADMNLLRIQQLENKLELLKTGRSLLANRDNFPPQFKEVGDDMIRMMMPPEMKQMLKGSTIESLDREILQIENVLKNLKVGKDKRALNAEGGLATMFRPKLKDGGPPNPGRRTFMKLMAGLASIPIVGKIFKPAAKVSSVVPLKNTTTTMPDWFPSFVDKIVTRNVGNKIDADLTVFKDKDLPGITVTKHDDGRINVSGQNEYYADYEIDYTPPGYELVDESTGKAVKTKGEFEAVDADPIADYDGTIADYEPRVLGDVDEVMSSDARRMEAYATGKNEKDIPMKSGEGKVIENEVRADQAADYARENYDGPEDFAKGGLATMFRKK